MHSYVIAAFFTIAKIWKWLKCPLIGEQIKKNIVAVVQSLGRVWLFCNPMYYSPLDSSVHGISQTRILEWIDICFSRQSSQPRAQTHVFCIGRCCETEWFYCLVVSFLKDVREDRSSSKVTWDLECGGGLYQDITGVTHIYRALSVWYLKPSQYSFFLNCLCS